MTTLRQEKFILKWIETGNGTQSAIDAGYSPKSARFTASTLLAKPNISQRIQELRERIGREGIADIQERYKILTDISKDDRIATGSGLPANSARNQAIDIMNKMDRVYEQPTININDIKIQIVYEDTPEIEDATQQG